MEINSSLLGKKADYSNQYAPELLYPIPRKLQRDLIQMPSSLPFSGVDIWNCFELSWLNSKGKPIVALAEFYFPCSSPNIIESKSFKLYLNSLTFTRFDSVDEVRELLLRDLSAIAECVVDVKVLLADQFVAQSIEEYKGICLDDLDIEVNQYKVDATLLRSNEEITVKESLYSNLLKSNCLVTGQPDWGTVCVRYSGAKIDHAGLLKYIISFRDHMEFHEQCIERIFMDLSRQCRPEYLTVYGRYTRRGGLDINPFRSNFEEIPANVRHARQ